MKHGIYDTQLKTLNVKKTKLATHKN